MKLFASYILLLLLSFSAIAQEENTSIFHAKRYLDVRIKSQEKSNKKTNRQQKKLLKKLHRKDARLGKKLKKRDSLQYTRYLKDNLTYDSIARIKQSDFTHSRRYGSSVSGKVDSLKGVKKFIEDKANVTGDKKSNNIGYEDKLNQLNQESENANKIKQLTNQRTNYLKSIKTKDGKRLPGIKSITKKSYYSNKKTEVFQQAADEPSSIETKALEYLQGKEGFDKYLNHSSTESANASNGMTLDELEKKGFQTKRKLNENLQQKIGGEQFSSLQDKMGGQVKDYQNDIKKLKTTKNNIKQSKSGIKGSLAKSKPDFKINPMRGLPLSKRISKQYNWQTARATIDGRPAIFTMALLAEFKHTQTLSYGAGIASSIGLGKNWNQIKFTFEGVGFRIYTTWIMHYGIGAYAGYERMYKSTLFLDEKPDDRVFVETAHNKEKYSESIMLGLVKTYRINDKINGSIQVLYDIWWKEKGLRNPIQLRFTTMKN